jgi:hypothetical protein
VKAEARGDRTEALLISNLSSKYGFLLLWLLVGPVLFSLRFFLTLWLHQMPEETVVFCAALLVALLLDMLSAGFVAAVQAEGRIAAYQVVVGFLLCVSVPVGYLLLRFHLPASSVLWATAASSVLANAGRVWFLCKRIGLSAMDWATGVLRPCAVICAACCVAMGTVVMSVKPGFLHLASLYLVNSVIAAVLSWGFASSDAERTLRQAYVLRLQEAVSGSRRALVFATRKQ